MCGICGQYVYDKGQKLDPVIIQRMTDSIEHRGPDDEGFFSSNKVDFGFRRLSIIDLSGGHQPMSNKEKTVWIVFNGEIYNYPSLRRELESLGHEFQTNSDTEVIIHGYIEWGLDVFNHLNGMFGLAIWDKNKKRLVIARDPMGIKQVYFSMDKDRLLFASELRAILASRGDGFDVDPVALNLFLRYRYTPSPLTIHKGINKLPPGMMIVVENDDPQVKRWYNFKPTPLAKMPSDQESKEKLLQLYKDAVKRHLLSDVPVGLLLSGGVDSGLLLGLMNQKGEGWNTYTVGYGKKFVDDELKDAIETAEIFASNHHSVQIDKNTFETALTKIVSCLEEPIASSSIVPMYYVCERARQDVKVALIGQGPDELFGGYKRHLGVHYGAYWRYLPNWMRNKIADFIKTLPRNETLKRGIYSLNEKERMKRYQHVFSLLPGEDIDQLFHDGLLPDVCGDAILDYWKPLEGLMQNLDELGGFQFLELRSSLPDELLMYSDKLSMAHSLEVRVPYLDKEIVEYVQCLSASFKVRYGERKWLHKQVCKDFLPKQIIQRKKRGFAVNVVDDWFKTSMTGKMREYLYDNESLMYQYLKPEVVQKLLKEHTSGENDNHKVLFSIIVFEEWLRNQKSLHEGR